MNLSFAARGWLPRLASLLVGAACLAGPARAAVYTAVWDPAFGHPYLNLGWRGMATYFVPDSCEPPGTVDIVNASACGGAAALTSAAVELYDVTAPGQPTLDTLVFNPASLPIGQLRFVDGNLQQVTTGWSNFVLATADLSAFGADAGLEFFVEFTFDGPRLGTRDCPTSSQVCDVQFNDNITYPLTYSITRQPTAGVPEPTSLALAGLALAAVLSLRRRRPAR